MTGKKRKSGREKRRFPRLDAKYLISYEYFDEELGYLRSWMGLSQNLSIGGVMITIDKKVRAGATLFLEIALQDNVIKATGKIAHIFNTDGGKFDVGVSFTQIKPSDLELLTQYYKDKGLNVDPPK